MFTRLLTVLGLALLAPPGLQAQTDRTLEDLARPLLAERLGVPEAQVALEVGRVPTDRTVDVTRPLELKGSGSGGIYILDVTATDGGRLGVQIKAGVRAHEAVAARALTRGHRLEVDDIRLVEVVHYGNAPTTATTVQGWEVARTISAGDPLREPAIRQPPVVRSGQSVQVHWSNTKVVLSLAGTALSTGAAGETITVRLGTGRRVRGVAQPDGTIRLEGGAL